MSPASPATVPPDLLFDLETLYPAIADHLFANVPELQSAMAAIRSGIPLADSCADGIQGPFYRLPRHFRSVCAPLVEPARDAFFTPCVTFKGTEPLLGDFERFLSWMTGASFRTQDLPMADYFSLVLKMPPGAMPLDECFREQKVSIDLQAAHLAQYNELAHAPVPLFVHRVSKADVERYLAQIKRVLAPQAVDRVRARVAGGLGVEIYYSPCTQLRVEDLFASEPWLTALIPRFTPGAGQLVVNFWVRSFARVLHLGYLPYASWNAGWGGCFDIGNACVDGGIVDLGTLVTIDSFHDYRGFRLAWSQSMDMLSRTVLAFCAAIEPRSAEQPSIGLAALVSNYIAPKVMAAVAAELPRRTASHPWLARATTSNGFDDLLASLKDLAPRSSLYRSSV